MGAASAKRGQLSTAGLGQIPRQNPVHGPVAPQCSALGVPLISLCLTVPSPVPPRSLPGLFPVLGLCRSRSSEPPGGALAAPAALGGARDRRRKDAAPARAHGARRVPPPQVWRAGEKRGGAGGPRGEGAEEVLWGTRGIRATGGRGSTGGACAMWDLGGTGGNRR